MKFYTKDWYLKFYGHVITDDNTLDASYRIAAEWQKAEFAAFPPDVPFIKYNFHDALITKIELISDSLIMYMNTQDCHCSVDRVTFHHVLFENLPDDFRTKNHLYWMVSELAYRGGYICIGILFQDYECWQPFANMPKTKLKLDTSHMSKEFPEPYILEFRAKEIAVHEIPRKPKTPWLLRTSS